MKPEIRALGNSGLLVSRIGLGLAALGRPGYINLDHGKDLKENYDPESMQKHCHAVMDAAWEAGIRYFDTARSYGKGEEFVGNWLEKKEVASTQVSIGSKWGYRYTADWQVQADHHEIKEHSPEMFQKQFAESTAILGTHLKLYQIHSATKDSGVLNNKEVLRLLLEKKQGGMLIGLTLSGIEQSQLLEQALEIKFDGVLLFDTVQATWNILETSATEMLKEAKKQGLGVILKEVLANGRLTERNKNPEFSDKHTILSEMAGILETSLDALAIAAALHNDWADVVLSGAANEKQLASNLSALNVDLQDLIHEMRQLRETPDFYWKRRGDLAWN